MTAKTAQIAFSASCQSKGNPFSSSSQLFDRKAIQSYFTLKEGVNETMAKIIHCHPSKATNDYHVYTDLDFWDARLILKNLATVKRNFGNDPPGDEYPTQVVADDLNRSSKAVIEKRLKKAIVSPPRHVLVDGLLKEGYFEFDPLHYYPKRWSRERMFNFTWRRLPLNSAILNSPYRTVRVSWRDQKIRIERIPREKKYDPVIETKQQALRRRNVPSCF
jgi:hypothetical protein